MTDTQTDIRKLAKKIYAKANKEKFGRGRIAVQERKLFRYGIEMALRILDPEFAQEKFGKPW